MLELTNDIIIHLDAPTMVAEQFKQVPIQGWIVCHAVIQKVWISVENEGIRDYELKLVERPDVVEAYPSHSQVKGFIGIVPTNSLNSQSITFFFNVDGKILSHTFHLEEQESSPTLPFLKSINSQLYADDVAQKRTRLESTPVHINLEITNRCNLGTRFICWIIGLWRITSFRQF